MLKVDVDLTAAIGQLDALDKRVAEAVRPAVWAGVQMLRREAELRAPRSHRSHYFYSKSSGGEPHVFVRGKNKGKTGSRYLFHPGDLKKSVYVKHIDENSITGVREEYAVSYRKVFSSEGYVPYGSMVHNGVAKRGIPENPFVFNAYQALAAQIEARIVDGVRKAAHGKTVN